MAYFRCCPSEAHRGLATVFAVIAASALGAVRGEAVGCVSYNYQWLAQLSPNASLPISVPDADACKLECVATSGCAAYTYGPTVNSCWLGQPMGGLSELPGAVSGKPDCDEDEPPACSASVAQDSWPAATAEESAALWSTGYQPTRMQCYPFDPVDGPALCPSVEPIVLQDVASGWPGHCKQLTNVTLLENETCESKCLAEPWCPSWQLGWDGTCWQGVGYNCNEEFSWNSSFHPTNAQRIQHGSVRQLAQVTGFGIPGLQNVFTVDPAIVDPEGDCRKVCYSVISCAYWQLSSQTGCWADVPNAAGQRPPYPLTAAVLNQGPEPGSNFIAGEYIQHFCPEPEEEEAGAGWAWWQYALVAAALLCLLAMCGFGCYHLYGCYKRRAAKTRGLQLEESKPLTFLPPVYAQPADGMNASFANASFASPNASFVMAPQAQTFVAPQYLPQAGYGLAPGGMAGGEQLQAQQSYYMPAVAAQYNYNQLPQQAPGFGGPQGGFGGGYGGGYGGGGGGGYPY